MEIKQKILIVDDEQDFRETLARLFVRRGLDVDTADGYETMLARLQAASFGVVILDVSMPGVNGMECLEKIKQQWPATEVIMLTGHASVHSGLQGMKGGAFDYCLKPIEPDELLEKIQMACEKISGRAVDKS